MPSLSEIQRAFRSALLGGDATSAAAAVAPDGLRTAARLDIYRHHVATSLTHVLEDTYPVVRRLVDPRFFGYAAGVFIRRHPPTGPCLFEYGEGLAAFLVEFPPCRALRYLPDVARLEWALHLAHHAPSTPMVSPTAIATVPPDDLPKLRLRFHPSVRLLTSPYPVDQIWWANQPGADPEAVVDLGAGAAHLMTYRRFGDAVWEHLAPSSYTFRASLAGGAPLGQAAEVALGLHEEFDLALELRELFTSFIWEIAS